MILNRLPLLLLLFFVSYFTAVAQPKTVEDPDPLRFEGEIEQFKTWDQKNSFPSDAILFTGSSSIRMWKTAEAFPEFPIINRGFGGSHTSDVQYFYEEVIGKYNPSVILFYEGDNDIASDKPVEQVFGDYKQLVNRILNDHPEVTFVYIPIKPSSSRWNYWPKMKEFNQLVEQFNEDNSQLHYIDLATPMLGTEGKPDDSLFLDDQLHLNEKGYARWNEVLLPVLKELTE